MLTCRECGEEIDDEGYCPSCRNRIESYSVTSNDHKKNDAYFLYSKEFPKIKWEMAILAMGQSLKRGLLT